MRCALLAVVAVPLTARADAIHPVDPTACPFEDGVVGDRPCPGFGTWGAARESAYTVATIAAHVRVLPRPPRDAIARSTSEPAPAGGSDVSYGFAEGITFAVARPLFVGVELELGMSSVAEDPSSRALRIGAAGLIGLQVPLGPLALAGELAGGGRVLETTREVRIEADPTLEARVRAMVWLSPWFTVGGVLGSSLVTEGEWMAGLQLSFHSWSFGGR